MATAELAFPKAFCVSSTGGGGGKTLLTLALCGAYAQQGLVVQPFKKGPDYIDAAWLSLASGRKTVNLDPFFLSPAQILAHFQNALGLAKGSGENVLGILEGNRGLYDGLDVQGSCSTANVARILGIPILLCVSCEKTTRTMAAMLKGLTSFEAGLTFCGVVLNRVGSQRHEQALRQVIAQETDLKVMGSLPRLAVNPLPERHMGLASRGPGADPEACVQLASLARIAKDHCDLEAILANAASVAAIRPAPAKYAPCSDRPVIGYVEDPAFWFYYPENLEALRDAGATLRKLSICQPDESWADLDGLYLGGGFPEDFGEIISHSPALSHIRQLAKAGRPVYAECGGLMLLCHSLEVNGKTWPMANIFSARVQWHKRPIGLGYVECEVIQPNPYFRQGVQIRGHEFHYSGCAWPSVPANCCLKLRRGKGVWQSPDGAGYDGLVWKNVWGSYMHIFAPAVPAWATAFVSIARR